MSKLRKKDTRTTSEVRAEIETLQEELEYLEELENVIDEEAKNQEKEALLQDIAAFGQKIENGISANSKLLNIHLELDSDWYTNGIHVVNQSISSDSQVITFLLEQIDFSDLIDDLEYLDNLPKVFQDAQDKYHALSIELDELIGRIDEFSDNYNEELVF